MSVARIFDCLYIFAKVIAKHPDPVPKSAIFKFLLISKKYFLTVSIINSVSGLGSNT